MTIYNLCAKYRRTVSSIPQLKQLLPIKDEFDQPISFGDNLGDLCPNVVFYKLEDKHGNLFWGKRWLHEMAPLTPITRQIEAFLQTLGRDDLNLSVDYSSSYGIVYQFNQTLFSSQSVVHFWNRYDYFSYEECAEIEALGNVVIEIEGLPRLPLHEVVDFQITRVDTKLIYLDFEPWPKYLQG